MKAFKMERRGGWVVPVPDSVNSALIQTGGRVVVEADLKVVIQ